MKLNYNILALFLLFCFKSISQNALLIKGDKKIEIQLIEYKNDEIKYVILNDINQEIRFLPSKKIHRLFCQDDLALSILYGFSDNTNNNDLIIKTLGKNDALCYYREYKKYNSPVIISSIFGTPIFGLYFYIYSKNVGIDSNFVTTKNEYLWTKDLYKHVYISTALEMNKKKARKSYITGSIIFPISGIIVSSIIYISNNYILF
jgi:hypothetical protein